MLSSYLIAAAVTLTARPPVLSSVSMSNLKVLLNREWWVPGEEISGDFIVETAEGFNVERIAIHLKCVLTTKILNKRPEVEKWQEYDEIFSKSPYSQKLYKHYGIESADINLAPSGIFRNPSDAWKEGKIDRDVISREEEIVLYSETLDRDVGLDNCGFPTGTTTVPFSITPKCDFSSLIQSGDLKSRGGTTIIGANYYLEIYIHYPVSFLNIVTMAWKESVPLTVLHASTVPDPLQTTEYVSEYLVHLWEKESYGFGQMLKYAVGKDTSSVQFPMKLILQVPSLVQLHYGQPVYLNDVLTLKTIYNPTKQIQLVPAMELTGLKASIVTMMTKRIHKLEKIKNSKQSQESTY